MYITTQALVLSVTNYQETDALLTILSKTHGRLKVKAKGLRRKNSPLIAPCQLLAYSEFTLFEYRGFYTINEAYSIELFTPLRSDLNKLTLGTYFVEAARVLSQQDYPDEELLSLVLNCLYVLAYKGLDELMVKAVFELRAACIAGYEPDLFGCRFCNCGFPDYFNIKLGRLECSDCTQSSYEGIRLPVSVANLAAMRYICTCNEKRLFSFAMEKESLIALSQITESFFCTQLERGFSSLDFYKSLQEPFC